MAGQEAWIKFFECIIDENIFWTFSIGVISKLSVYCFVMSNVVFCRFQSIATGDFYWQREYRSYFI